MHIYIDEAGNFIIPTQRSNYISCVTALTIPSCKKQYLFDRFLQLRTSWGSKSAEIKGSTLDEKQVQKIIEVLAKYDSLLEIFAIDGLAQSEASITKFRQMQADKITEHLGPEHHPDMVKELEKLARQIRSLPNQLFVQAFLTTRLCEEAVRTGTLFWSQRVPKELSEFVWTIDAKDKTVTQPELMWKTLLMPFLEARSVSNPLMVADDPNFDYTYLENLTSRVDESWKRHIEWMRRVHGMPAEKKLVAMDMRPLYRDMTFADSQNELGLQLADIMASAFHRACKGTLQKPGWKDLGSLFILRREAVVNLVALGPDVKDKEILVENELVADVLLTIRRGARSIAVKPF
jgi:hypothetical protein